MNDAQPVAVSIDAFVDAMADIVGAANVLVTEDDKAGYPADWRKRYVGRALAVVRPATVDQVARVVRLCVNEGIAIVPQGGNTGLVGGAMPGAVGAGSCCPRDG